MKITSVTFSFLSIFSLALADTSGDTSGHVDAPKPIETFIGILGEEKQDIEIKPDYLGKSVGGEDGEVLISDADPNPSYTVTTKEEVEEGSKNQKQRFMRGTAVLEDTEDVTKRDLQYVVAAKGGTYIAAKGVTPTKKVKTKYVTRKKYYVYPEQPRYYGKGKGGRYYKGGRGGRYYGGPSKGGRYYGGYYGGPSKGGRSYYGGYYGY
jgi:hypothetical protein